MKFTAAEEMHRSLLERWRKAMNLVGPRSAESDVDAAASVGLLRAVCFTFAALAGC